MIDSYLAVQNSIAIAKELHHSLSFTGHSLGAWLAELSVYFAYVHLNYGATRALTFDSPGSSDFFNALKSNIQNHITDFNLKNLDITTYLSIPNIINSCNRHLGNVYSVTPRITQAELERYYNAWQASRLRPFFMLIDPDSKIISILTVLGHSLESIVREFNATTGTPSEYRQMLDWPCLICNYKHTDHILETFRGLTGTIATAIMQLSLPSYSTLPAYRIANMLVDLMQGRTDLSQYLRVIKDEVLPNIRQENITTDAINSNRELYLKFEGHFSWKTPNPYIEPMTGSNVMPDYYLKQFITLRYYFIYSYQAKICNLTNVVANTVESFSHYCEYISPSMHDRYQYGTLNSTDSVVTLDVLKQAVTRLHTVSLGTIQKCLDLYETGQWFAELMRISGWHDSKIIAAEYINSGKDLNTQDLEGNTLLHHAVANHRAEASLLLAVNGASISIKNNAGRSAYDTAVDNGDFSIANGLQKFRHIQLSTEVINMDAYGIYDGNTQKNTFIVNPEFKGKQEGLVLMIDHFGIEGENMDRIDLSKFGYSSMDAIKFELTKVMDVDGVKIIDKSANKEIVTVLHLNEAQLVKEAVLLGKVEDKR